VIAVASFLLQAAHTVSTSIEGPYKRAGLAIPTQTHNTYYAYSQADKLHLIYSIFGGKNPESCNPYKNCTNGTTPGHGGGVKPDHWKPDPSCPLDHGTYVHYSSSLNGPWQNAGPLRVNTSGCPHCGTSNPGKVYLNATGLSPPLTVPNNSAIRIPERHSDYAGEESGRDRRQGAAQHSLVPCGLMELNVSN
jgi:hypothetical protein